MTRWVIGIGAMKCASTWAYEVLRAHPNICMSDIKEIKYFDKHYHLGDAWYLNHFEHCSEEVIRGEFSPAYLYQPEAAQRLFKFAPDAKLIVCVRNPIDRALSHYKHLRRAGTIDARENPIDAVQANVGLIERGLYAKHLEPFLEQFPIENITIVTSEEIEKDPLGSVKRLYEQINVSADFLPKVATKRVHKGTLPRILWMELARVQLYRYITATGKGRLLQLIKKYKLPELYRRINTTESGNEHFTSEVRAQIAEYFRDDVATLKEITGRSFPDWHEFI